MEAPPFAQKTAKVEPVFSGDRPQRSLFNMGMFMTLRRLGRPDRKRGKIRGGVILRFTGLRESDSFLECRRSRILNVSRTPN